MSKTIKIKVFLTVWVIIVSFPAFGYLSSIFDVKRLLNEADAVCKIKVSTVENKGIYSINNIYPSLKAVKITAESKVISSIKGNIPETINIVFPASEQLISFTMLDKDEVAIVFLKRVDKHYEFIDIHNGKMDCINAKIKYQNEENPEDKILSELLALCKQATGKNKLYAIQRLGELEDIRAKKILTKFSISDDSVLRGTALDSLIQMGVSVKEKKLLDYLKLPPELFDEGKSLDKYGTTGFSTSHLQNNIIFSLKNSVKLNSRNRSTREPRVIVSIEDFDYISFYEKVSKLKVFTNSLINRRSMASALRKLADKRSIPLVKSLLRDPSPDVRYFAVTTFQRIFNEGDFPSFDLFHSDEQKYILYWKNKLSEKNSKR